MAGGPTKKENAAARKARIERERAGQYHVLWQYYATGGGSDVPPERVATNVGVDLHIAIYNLGRYGRKDLPK